MPHLEDHPLAQPSVPDSVFDGRRWQGVLLAKDDDPTTFAVVTVQPSVLSGFWHLDAVAGGLGQSLAKPVTRAGLPLVLKYIGVEPGRVSWTPLGVVDTPVPLPVATPAPTVPGVYFAVTEGDRFVKIGWAKDAEKRRTELQTGCPYRLRIVATVPGTLADESAFHRRFDPYRAREDGEWFYLYGELADFIASLTIGVNQ